MNFTQLQCIVALAETGSFTEASYNVGLTQPAVSHALSSLENELGARLFERRRRGGVLPTIIGQKVIAHARVILVQVATIEQEVENAREKVAGKLRIGFLAATRSRLLAGLQTRFHAAYPDIELVPLEGTHQEIDEWLAHDIIDIGTVLYPTRKYKSIPLATDELCVLVPPGHHLSTRTAVTIEELRTEPLIIQKEGCMFMRMTGLDKELTTSTFRYISDYTTILALVQEGVGLSFLPRMMLSGKREGKTVLSLDPVRSLRLGLACTSNNTETPATRLFLQVAQAWKQEQALKFLVTSQHS